VAAARRRSQWGWHRLTDDTARALVDAAGVRRGDLVLDIGAGTGAITVPLVAAGARVIAVELHPARANMLRARFTDARVIVVQVDASDLRLPRRPFRVVANPPFAVTTALLRRLLAPGSRLVSADLVLGRAAARRWASRGGAGPFDLRILHALPRSAFVPRPRVDAVVLRIERRGLRA
jgi:23S rRNA (adenine-N6)-dimethyltransferase